MKRLSHSLLIFLLVFFAFRMGQQSSVSLDPETGLDFSVSKEVWSVVQDNYLRTDELDQEKIKYGLAKGLVHSLGDIHTSYMDPDESLAFMSSLSGELEGIGAELHLVDGVVQVLSPLPDSPAQEAGILPGDYILKIDGDTLGTIVDLNEVVMRIRGPSGSRVVLTVLHDGHLTPEDISIERASIHIDAVSWERKGSDLDPVAYIAFSSFTENSADEFGRILKEIDDNGYENLILDFRYNGGGFLEAAISVLSHFIDLDKTVVQIEYQDAVDTRTSTAVDVSFDGKVVVLINSSSASASEIVAGALQDYGRAHVIGTTSFGKGSVQEVHPLYDDSLLRITIAEWLTPLGRSIEGEGIEPDQIVELDYQEYLNGIDAQLDAALEYLSL